MSSSIRQQLKLGCKEPSRDRLGRLNLGDVIIALNDQPVHDYDSFYNLLSNVDVGQQIKLAVLRHGKPVNYKMKTIDIAAY